MPAESAAPVKSAQPPMALGPEVDAEQFTTVLINALQAARFAYLTVGMILCQIRDIKMYSLLGFADLESYAERKAHLGRSSVYQYIRIYEFALRNHPEWLNPGPDTFIPELNDAGDLMYIERELERDDLPPVRKAALTGLREKALKGELKKRDVAPFRAKANPGRDWRNGFLSLLRSVRSKAARYRGMPPEVIDCLDRAIDVLAHAVILKDAGMDDLQTPPAKSA